MVSMRAPFLSARANVILFRERYGNTPWTGVELAAIQDSCLKTGYRSLIFVQLDRKDAKPNWLPDTHIRCNMDDYSIEQLVGAIKNKVQENGGTIHRADAKSEAIRVRDEANYLADRDRLMRDYDWIAHVRKSISDTITEIGRLITEVNAESRLDIGFGTNKLGVTVLRSGYVSMGIGWQQPISNYVGDSDPNECHLWANEFSGMLGLTNEYLWYVEHPKKLKAHNFKVDVGRDRKVVWQRWSHFLRQPAKVDSPMQRTDHHEDAETVFG